ncbi:hypothetical protein LBMAG42_03630 [Deltaproteobacteria bacterium]|nr:hypothetical protein LBMAG42_03630 [Deltaproteobacteria bacterium]
MNRVESLDSTPKVDVNDAARAGATAQDIVDEAALTTPVETRLPPSGAWEPPMRFVETECATRFPVDTLPGWVAEFVTGVAVETQTPPDMAGTFALAVLATLLGGRVRVRSRGAHEEGVNLFVVVALPPGCRKSAVVRMMIAPLEQLERRLQDEAAPRLLEQRERLALAEANLAEARRAAKQDGNLDAVTALAKEVTDLKLPAPPRLLVDDATPERLAGLMSENGDRIAVVSAEGGIFDAFQGRYAKGPPNLDVYLKGHAGDRLTVDRVSREPNHIDRPALTVAVAVQPSILRLLATDSAMQGRGLLARFLYSVPPNPLGTRQVDPPELPQRAVEQWSRNVDKLARAVAADQSITVSLSPAALEVYRAFERELEPRLGPRGDLSQVAAWSAKLAGTSLRLAGLLHFADAAAGGDHVGDIGAGCMQRAVQLARYYLAHGLVAFGMMGADPVVGGAQRLLTWIEAHNLSEFCTRDAYHGTRTVGGSASDTKQALRLLEQHEYIRLVVPPAKSTGRPPSDRWEVNPHAWKLG